MHSRTNSCSGKNDDAFETQPITVIQLSISIHDIYLRVYLIAYTLSVFCISFVLISLSRQ